MTRPTQETNGKHSKLNARPKWGLRSLAEITEVSHGCFIKHHKFPINDN